MKTRSLISRIVSLIVISFFFELAILPTETSAAPLKQENSPLADQTWVRLGGPLGGIGYDIKMDPTNPDIMYVTDAFSGIHKSMDGGKTWFPINSGIETRAGNSGDSIPVFCVTIDPNNSNIIWAGLQNIGALYQSVDGGETWIKKVNGIVEKEGFTVRGISVEPGNSNTVYAAGEISSWLWAGKDINFQGFDMTKGVVYKSIDAGETWAAVWRGDNLARYIIIDPHDPNILYVSTGIFDRIAVNSDPQKKVPGGIGIFKSTDGGATWNPFNNGLRNLYVGSLYMSPNNPNILLAGTGHAFFDQNGGVYRTSNGGLDWTYVGGGKRAVSVEISTIDSQIAYAADVAHSKFFRSLDGGLTWKTLIRNEEEGWGPDGIFAGWPIDLQVDPRNPMRVFVNNYGGGNFLSEDGGETWRVSSTGYSGAQIYDLRIGSADGSTVYATGKSGAFRSQDGGKTWEGLGQNLFEGNTIYVDPQDSDFMLWARGHLMHFFQSSDGGRNWEPVWNYESQMLALQGLGTSAEKQGLSVIVSAVSDPNILYGGIIQQWCLIFGESCDSQTIFSVTKSIDRGKTWEPITGTPFDGSSVTDISVHPNQPDLVWVATAGKGIFRSINGGMNWEKISAAGEMNKARSLEINPTLPAMMLVGTDKGIYASQDGGSSWKKSSAGLDPNERIWDIEFDPIRNNIVYAGSISSGVYMSEDFGQKWNLINTGLTNRSVNTLSISSDGETLFAGTNGEGVFRLSTHGQDYFDTFAPTPTALPPTITPTNAATETPIAISTPILSTATPATQKPSITPIYIGGAIVLLIGFVAFTLWKRKSKSE